MGKLPDGVRIPNIEALNDALESGNTGFTIILGGGGIRSSKSITREGKKYHVFNDIDGSVQLLTKKQLLDESYTNIGVAMKRGAFFTLA